MSDDEKPPESVKWNKSTQIVRALGLPLTSVVSAIHFVRGWKNGDFDGDSLEAVLEIVIYLGLTVYYPIHAAVVWIARRVKAGQDPKSDAPKIVPPAAVTTAIKTVQRLTK